jgi:hypothetical protein
MRRSGVGSGGGYHTKQHVEKPVRTGVGNRGVSVGRVGQLGQMQGSHVTNRGDTGYRGEGKLHQGAALRPAMLGNEKALDVGKGGCGTGRTIYSTGSQSQHGQAAQGSKDILSQFGPEASKR